MLTFWGILEFFDFLEPDFQGLILAKLILKALNWILNISLTTSNCPFFACHMKRSFPWCTFIRYFRNVVGNFKNWGSTWDECEEVWNRFLWTQNVVVSLSVVLTWDWGHCTKRRQPLIYLVIELQNKKPHHLLLCMTWCSRNSTTIIGLHMWYFCASSYHGNTIFDAFLSFDHYYTLFKNHPKMSHLNFSIFAFSINFCQIKSFLKVNKIDQFWHF